MGVNAVRIIAAAVVFTIIAQIIHSIGAMLSMQFYLEPAYFSVWSPIMMPSGGAPGAAFYLGSIGLGFAGALLFVTVYSLLKDALKQKSLAVKGAEFGFLVFLVGALPGYFAMVLLINLPGALLAFWAVESIAIYLVAGAATGIIAK